MTLEDLGWNPTLAAAFAPYAEQGLTPARVVAQKGLNQVSTGDAEHYSVALDKGSALTVCVNAAIGRMTTSGELATLTQTWLADKANAPVFQP